MRIVHFADLHLGVERYGRIDPATGLSTRLGDFLKVFDELVDYALAESVDMVLCCGDAYHKRDPSQTHQREFAKRIGKLASHGIAVFLLVGNHDLPNAMGRANSVEIFDTLAIENTYIAGKPGTYRVSTKSGDVQVVALPWARRSALLAREETKNLTPEQANEKLQQTLTNILTHEIEALDSSVPTVLAGHLSVSTAKAGSEKTMLVGQDYFMLHSSLARPEIDYVALGHIHRQQSLSQLPPMVYAGSLERVDFGDENFNKGFYVVDLDQSKAEGERVTSCEFHAVSARRFLTIEVDANTDDSTATVIAAIAKKDISDAIVRLIIKVSEVNEPMINDIEIRRALGEAHYIGSIIKDVDRERRVRIGNDGAQSLTPIKALEVYLESKNTAPTRISKMLEYGKRLISGDDESASK
ncbi:MAG: exonuclease SbcCD subunit D [Chloroflexi bacterium]|jgi:DNA repair protein SbcD/Mre11|nr:exonuclease SbcCD subunit D [Chloroflexota bacterium]MBT7081794.1 exonuclease SbcCD subunit D [Chloroflexota bacterium]MBT7289052.1 exonuclease SbcCD subunit D [Chloroflexota bacterium]